MRRRFLASATADQLNELLQPQFKFQGALQRISIVITITYLIPNLLLSQRQLILSAPGQTLSCASPFSQALFNFCALDKDIHIN